MKSPFTKIFIILTIILLNFGCDQVTKSIVRKNVEYNQIIEVLGNSLILTKVENKGAFLSLGNELPFVIREILLSYFPLVMLLLASLYLFKNKKLTTPVIIFMSFVIGGGIGNIFDRILNGSVTDFLHMDLYLFRTGIFNMADVSIMIGSIGILFYYLFFTKSILRQTKEKKN